MMSPHLPFGPRSGKTGPSWPLWPALMTAFASVVSNRYGSLTDAVAWQKETSASAPCGAGVSGGGPVVVVCSGDVVVVDEVGGGAAVVDDEDEGPAVVVVVDVCAPAGDATSPDASTMAMA